MIWEIFFIQLSNGHSLSYYYIPGIQRMKGNGRDGNGQVVVVDEVVRVGLILILDQKLERGKGISCGRECFSWIWMTQNSNFYLPAFVITECIFVCWRRKRDAYLQKLKWETQLWSFSGVWLGVVSIYTYMVCMCTCAYVHLLLSVLWSAVLWDHRGGLL